MSGSTWKKVMPAAKIVMAAKVFLVSMITAFITFMFCYYSNMFGVH